MTTPGPERANLRFVEQVIAAFAFLTTEYEFRLAKVDVTFVRYESRNVFVNVYHGRGSYELNCEIGELIKDPNRPERPFSLGEILDLEGVRKKVGYTFFQASSSERVREFAPRLAELLRRNAKSVLDGDADTFERLAELRFRKAQEFEKQESLILIREQVVQAWSRKDYLKVIELYEPVQDDLTPAEIKKLEYARKHL